MYETSDMRLLPTLNYVSMLAEVNETIENAKNVVNVVALPPEAGDCGSQESDLKMLLTV